MRDGEEPEVHRIFPTQYPRYPFKKLYPLVKNENFEFGSFQPTELVLENGFEK